MGKTPGSHRKQRSMKNARSTLDMERRANAKTCRHSVFRFRNRSTEQVCSACGAVRLVARDDFFGIRVVRDWVDVHLTDGTEEETKPPTPD